MSAAPRSTLANLRDLRYAGRPSSSSDAGACGGTPLVGNAAEGRPPSRVLALLASASTLVLHGIVETVAKCASSAVFRWRLALDSATQASLRQSHMSKYLAKAKSPNEPWRLATRACSPHMQLRGSCGTLQRGGNILVGDERARRVVDAHLGRTTRSSGVCSGVAPMAEILRLRTLLTHLWPC